MHFLVTGHTGFKGSWLAMMLSARGHEVSGIALDPLPGSLFESAELPALLTHDVRQDIRDAKAVTSAFSRIRPDFVIHLAAQPLVRESYRDPRGTIETNVIGTMNVLEAIGATDGIAGSLIITTDKVYRNVGQVEGYVESDALGGDDPYSASKAMADILTSSWLHSFGGPPTAIARAGNVIGGGDVSPDRLIPDLIEAFSANQPVQLRYPEAVRPWQHVLDCLNGYLSLVDAVLNGSGSGAWNFGPGPEGFKTVAEVTEVASTSWGEETSWQDISGDHLHEAALLALDARRAETQLGWRNKLTFEESVKWTMDWFKAVRDGESPRDVTRRQIDEFAEMA